MLVSQLRPLFVVSILVVFSGALAIGCGSTTVSDVCNLCPRSGKVIKDCVAEGSNEEILAQRAGCAEEFQAFLDCIDAKGTCGTTDSINTEACNAEADVVDKCGKK